MISEKLQKARDYEATHDKFIAQKERPAYHLSSRVGWMNDPNGFCFYNGQYHLFYQYHPYSLHWGPMHWGHAVSNDMLHWTYLPCALAPDTNYDGFGCFSGSAIALPDGKHLLMYTGVREELQPDGEMKTIQAQCLAWGNGLNYEKYPENPVIDGDSLPDGFSRLDFRDPKLWQEEDGSYACIIGARTDDGSGALLLFRSKDALHWKYDSIIDRCCNEFGKMWECPDFFTLDGKDVIITSPQDMYPSGLEFHNGNNILCLIGRYDTQKKRFERENLSAVDYGIDCYAAQSTLLPDGRRVMVAWMQNWDACVIPDPKPRWFGQMTVPRELRIVNGALRQAPIRELEALRRQRIYHKATICGETALNGVFGRIVDLTVTVTPIEDLVYEQFNIKLACGKQHFTLLTYKPKTSILKLDRSKSGSYRDVVHERRCFVRQQGGKLKLRILLDRFSIEVFVNDGEQVLSATIYTPQSDEGISFEIVGQAQIEVEKYDLGL